MEVDRRSNPPDGRWTGIHSQLSSRFENTLNALRKEKNPKKEIHSIMPRGGAAKGRKALRASPPWYRAVETAYFISDQRQVLLLPGSPASTLLYSSDPAAQEQMWSWWYRDAWLSGSTFDK